jgi:hypothetical protein
MMDVTEKKAQLNRVSARVRQLASCSKGDFASADQSQTREGTRTRGIRFGLFQHHSVVLSQKDEEGLSSRELWTFGCFVT